MKTRQIALSFLFLSLVLLLALQPAMAQLTAAAQNAVPITGGKRVVPPYLNDVPLNRLSTQENNSRLERGVFTVSSVTTRVSVASNGTQGDGLSVLPSISADGRYVAFKSGASNLVSDDTNGMIDIFLHDRQTEQTTRVSVASDGTQGDNVSDSPSISADGRYVAFISTASNLVSGDTNGTRDVFVHDLQTRQTSRVSVSSDGTQGNIASDDPSISADGRYVAFSSHASNLVSGDTNSKIDIFVHDQQTGETTRISVASNGAQSSGGHSYRPSSSADGRYVAFSSEANNLISNDTNGLMDIFIHDQQTGQTTLVSVTPDGTQGNGDSDTASISADGRYVTLQSTANNLVSGDTNGYRDIFVNDQQTGQITRVSVASDSIQGNSNSENPDISADGRYVTFSSTASNLVDGNTNGYRVIVIHQYIVKTILHINNRITISTS